MTAQMIRRRRAPRLLIVGALLAVLVSQLPITPASAEPVGSVSGRVTGADAGEALANVWVTLTPVTGAGTQEGAPLLATTDGAGRYEFSAVDAASVKIHVMSPLSGEYVTTYWPEAYTSADAGIIELTDQPVSADLQLPRGGSTTGQVQDAMTSAPIDGARITATLADDPSAQAVGPAVTTDVTGTFSISGLPPVPIDLTVEPPPGSSYVSPGDGPAGDDLRISGSSDSAGTVIRLHPGAEIRGRVLDDSGAPVARASVSAVGCAPTCPPEAITDSSGAYRLEGVAPGAGLRVKAVPGQGLLSRWFLGGDAAAPASALSAEAGDVIEDVDIVLVRSAHVTVRVRGTSRAEPLRAIVWLRTTGRIYGQYFAHRPGDDLGLPGEPISVRVGPIPPGEYAVSISPGAQNPGHLPVRWSTVAAGAPTGSTIQIAAGQEAEAVVQFAPMNVAPDPAPSEATPVGAADWPGLDEGFLTQPEWPDPQASGAAPMAPTAIL
ncbi:MAG: carboxypeptidase regulatory-like domain-containing protein [Actinomycetota bacterium]|nr:carboxypeptidase regulatory-like domain-containing protein [Actinomycetota bacterium]